MDKVFGISGYGRRARWPVEQRPERSSGGENPNYFVAGPATHLALAAPRRSLRWRRRRSGSQAAKPKPMPVEWRCSTHEELTGQSSI